MNVGNEKDVISYLFEDINEIPLLQLEEEKILAEKAKTDLEARNKLVQSNLRFVIKVAQKYRNQGLPLEDLISEGTLGLISAIDKYEVSRGYHFISYAVWWIRQAMQKAIYDKSRSIRLPLNRTNQLIKIRKIMAEFDLTEKESDKIAELAQIEKEDVAKLLSMSHRAVSLEQPVYTDNSEVVLSETISDKNVEAPEDLAMQSVMRDDINKVLDSLTEKEAEVVRRRYGLNGQPPVSLQELGDYFSLTKERIRQIEKSAIRALQKLPAAQKLLRPYLVS